MNLIKSKLKNGIWYNGVLWKVRDIISPNKFQDFVIVERVVETVEEDGTDTVEMFMRDAGNDLFYPNVLAVAKVMKRRQKEDKMRAAEEYGDATLRGSLRDCYLSMFSDEP